MMPTTRCRSTGATALLALAAFRLGAQSPDTLRLGDLQRAAITADRRAVQPELLAEQSSLRRQSLRAERKPAFMVQSQAQYLSDVTSFGGAAGSPPAIPKPYQDQYDASVSLRQRLYDPTLGGREAVESAQLGAAQAEVATALWQPRQQVNDAFFAMLRLDAQGATLDAAITDLLAQRRLANERVTNGVALPSEVMLLDAEIARRRQDRDRVSSEREAARETLASLTGRSIAADAVLEAPALANAVALVQRGLDGDRSRPEYAQFAATDHLLTTEREAVDATLKPRVSAFVRGGYGRPGLNQLSRVFDSYYQAGVQLEWSPWNWGTSHRDQEINRLQADILRSNEAAFTETLRRATIHDLATIAQLERSLASDDTIITLRERVLAETRLRTSEGVTTSAEYIDRETDLLLARLDRDSHRTRLVETRAHLLTTVGHEVR